MNNLVLLNSDGPTGTPEPGMLAVARLWHPRGSVDACCRINRVERGDAWITIIGLSVPEPYELGFNLTVPLEKIVDWSA